MSTDQVPFSPKSSATDLQAKYVRLLERRANGLVSFEFSIGWHELAVELLLPSAAFDEFCTANQVTWRDN